MVRIIHVYCTLLIGEGGKGMLLYILCTVVPHVISHNIIHRSTCIIHVIHNLSFFLFYSHFSILIPIPLSSFLYPHSHSFNLISLFPFLYLSSFPFHSRQKPTLRSKVYCLSHSVTQQIMVKYNQLTESHSWDWRDWLQDRYSMGMSTTCIL